MTSKKETKKDKEQLLIELEKKNKELTNDIRENLKIMIVLHARCCFNLDDIKKINSRSMEKKNEIKQKQKEMDAYFQEANYCVAEAWQQVNDTVITIKKEIAKFYEEDDVVMTDPLNQSILNNDIIMNCNNIPLVKDNINKEVNDNDQKQQQHFKNKNIDNSDQHKMVEPQIESIHNNLSLNNINNNQKNDMDINQNQSLNISINDNSNITETANNNCMAIQESNTVHNIAVLQEQQLLNCNKSIVQPTNPSLNGLTMNLQKNMNLFTSLSQQQSCYQYPLYKSINFPSNKKKLIFPYFVDDKGNTSDTSICSVPSIPDTKVDDIITNTEHNNLRLSLNKPILTKSQQNYTFDKVKQVKNMFNMLLKY